MADHAMLSPSSASRWLSCTPSAKLEYGIKKSSTYADEGTLAHSLGELIILRKLGRINKISYETKLAKIKKSKYFNNEMFDICDDYAGFVIETYNKCVAENADTVLFTEVILNLNKFAPDSFGTSDVVIVFGNKIILIDLKFGKGIAVSAVENKQLMLYALGALENFGFLYDLTDIELIIYQPRILDEPSQYEMLVKDLYAWAEAVVIPKSKLAAEGKGEFVVGDHCRFCAVREKCRALSEYNLEVARDDFKKPDLLDDDELIKIFQRSHLFTNWLTAVEKYLADQAINHNKKFEGLKIVEGRAKRIYAKEDEVILKQLAKYGYKEEDVTKTTLLGITEMEKKITKKDFQLFLEKPKFVIKPAGSPTLVVAEDPRPEFNNYEKAKEEFNIEEL